MAPIRRFLWGTRYMIVRWRRQWVPPCVLTASGHQDRPRLEAMGVPVLGGLEELPAYLKGLRLRPLRAEDASAVFAMTSDPRVARVYAF